MSFENWIELEKSKFFGNKIDIRTNLQGIFEINKFKKGLVFKKDNEIFGNLFDENKFTILDNIFKIKPKFRSVEYSGDNKFYKSYDNSDPAIQILEIQGKLEKNGNLIGIYQMNRKNLLSTPCFIINFEETKENLDIVFIGGIIWKMFIGSAPFEMTSV